MPDDPPQTLATGRFLEMVKEGRWEYVRRVGSAGAVAIIAVTPQRELVLVEQHRVPLGRPCLELPAGLAGDGDDPEEAFERAARRELEEETGYRADTMRRLWRVCTSPGLTGEVIDMYHAAGLTRVGDGGGAAHEGEDITVHRVPLDDADRWLAQRVDAGDAIDVKVYTAVALAQVNGW